MDSILAEACARLGRAGSEAQFVELFRSNWIESLADYVQYHESLSGQVPVKLHATLMQMAKDGGIAVADAASEVSEDA